MLRTVLSGGKRSHDLPPDTVHRDDSIPFPERGVTRGWRDSWEEDPVVAARTEVAEMARRIRAEARRARRVKRSA